MPFAAALRPEPAVGVVPPSGADAVHSQHPAAHGQPPLRRASPLWGSDRSAYLGGSVAPALPYSDGAGRGRSSRRGAGDSGDRGRAERVGAAVVASGRARPGRQGCGAEHTSCPPHHSGIAMAPSSPVAVRRGGTLRNAVHIPQVMFRRIRGKHVETSRSPGGAALRARCRAPRSLVKSRQATPGSWRTAWTTA